MWLLFFFGYRCRSWSTRLRLDAEHVRRPNPPIMSFRLYLLFLAFNFLRPIEMFAPDLAFLRIMVILSALTLVFSYREAKTTGLFSAEPQHTRLAKWFVALLIMSRLSVGWVSGAMAVPGEISVSIFFLYTTFANVTSIERLKATCKTFAYCLVALSILGIYSWYTGFMVEQLVLRQNVLFDDVSTDPIENLIPAQETNPKFLWRLHSLGLLADPNDFSQALVVALPMLFGLRVPGQRIGNLVKVYLPIAICMYAINLTHSRGALLGVASLMFFGVRAYLGTTRTTVMMVLGALAATALNVTGGRAYTANEESAGGRIDAWSEGLRMLAGHPLFGVGLGRFTEYHIYTAHNSFVLCFAESGFIGYFVWLGLIVLSYKGLAYVIDQGAPGSLERQWATLLRSSLIGFLTCAFFLSKAFDPLLYLVLAFAIVTYSLSRKTQGGGSPTWAAPTEILWRKTAFQLEIFSVVAIYMIVVLKTATLGKSI